MSDKEPLTNEKKIKLLMEIDKNFRAPFILHAIVIEQMVGEIISRHFCSDEKKREEFFASILNGGDITFHEKTQILHGILKRNYSTALKQYPKLIGRLDKVRRFRNRLAHAALDLSDIDDVSENTEHITLAFYEDGVKKTHPISKDELQSRLEEAVNVMIELHLISVEIHGKQLL